MLGYLPSLKFLGVRLWVYASVILGILCFDLFWGLLQVAFILFGAKPLCARVLFVAVIFSVCDVVRWGGVVNCFRLMIGVLVVGVGCCALPISLSLFCLLGYPFVCFSFRCTRPP